jgi:hypothetical protein
MTSEQERDFHMSTLGLTFGLFAALASALVASGVILIVQLRKEQQRTKREAQAAKARRLRFTADGSEVTVPPIAKGLPKCFHVFLSHVWGSGCRATNARCLDAGCVEREILAFCTGRAKTKCASSSSASWRCSHFWRSSSTCVFWGRLGTPRQRLEHPLFVSPQRQVDDLEEIGDLEGYINRSSTCLIYCSNGYFESRYPRMARTVTRAVMLIWSRDPRVDSNCMRELVFSTANRKQTVTLIETDMSRGGLSVEEVHARLLQAEGSYAKWDFDAEKTPNGQALYDHLFETEPVEWNRECSHAAFRCCSADCGMLASCSLQGLGSSKT